MALIFRCDCCKKLDDGKPNSQQWLRRHTCKVLIKKSIITDDDDEETGVKYDLCKDCTTKLENFFVNEGM